MYSLVKRQAEVEILPMAADQGITAYTYSPLGGGLLSGKYASGGAGRLTEDARYAARYAPDYMKTAAADLAALAAELGETSRFVRTDVTNADDGAAACRSPWPAM